MPLPMRKLREQTTLRRELRVGALLVDPAAIGVNNAVRVDGCYQAVGDHDAGGVEAFQAVGDHRLRLVVERARGFVEGDDPRLGDKGAGDEEALGFAAGERVG
jgi:hypothetical protein